MRLKEKVICCRCGKINNLKLKISGDNEIYYICKCGHESMPIGSYLLFSNKLLKKHDIVSN